MPIEDEVPAKLSKKKRSGSKRKHKSKSMTLKEYMDLNERVTKLEHGMERMTSSMEQMTSSIVELKVMLSRVLKGLGLSEQDGEEMVEENEKTKVYDVVGTPIIQRMEEDLPKTEMPSTPSWLKMPRDDYGTDDHEVQDVSKHDVSVVVSAPVNEIPTQNTSTKDREESDVTEISPFKVIHPYVRVARKKRASVHISTPFTALSIRPKVSNTVQLSMDAANVYNLMHIIPNNELERLRKWITNKKTNSDLWDTITGKKPNTFFKDLFMCRHWLNDEHLDTIFLFIRLKLKANENLCSQNFTTTDTVFMGHLQSKWPLYQQCIEEKHAFDWQAEYSLIDCHQK